MNENRRQKRHLLVQGMSAKKLRIVEMSVKNETIHGCKNILAFLYAYVLESTQSYDS